LVKINSCLSCPKPLVKTTIPIGECEHLNQVGPFEKSHFLVVSTHGSIFNCQIHDFVHILNFKLEVQIMICKERFLLGWWMHCVVVNCFLPWPKILTNYLDDNWLCTVNIGPRLDWFTFFAHPLGGGKLITTSFSHLKVQRVAFRTWMQIAAHDKKWYL
jgi:hypothetical protein